MSPLPFYTSRFSSLLAACILALAVTACSDDGDDTGGDPPVDAAPVPDAEPTPDAAPLRSTGFVVAGDFLSGTGVASTISVPDLTVTQNVIAGVASDDPVVRHIGDTIYIINRFEHDNITRIDASTFALIDQISTGPGTNPQDVAVAGDKLYVAALGAPGIITIDAQGTLGSIDLSGLDPADGIPDCNSIYLVESTLVVSCGLLNNFVPSGPGRVALIDTADDSVVGDFALTTPNPIGLLRATPSGSRLAGALLVATYDFNDLTQGCVERISVDPVIESAGCLIDNSVLGGYATGLAHGPEEQLYIAVTTGFDAQGVVAQARLFDVSTGQLAPEPVSGPDEQTFDVTLCPTGEMLFADGNGGIRVYDAAGAQLTQDVLDVGLPPVGNGMVCF